MKRLTTEERATKFSRLPVWAQNELKNLQRVVEVQAAKIEELTAEFPDTNVKASGNYVYPDRTLPLNSEVAFKLSDEEYDYLQVRHDLNHNGFLHVMGSGQILVKSVCANVIEIGVYRGNRV